MNADCRDLRPLLSAYMDNDLDPQEVRAVQVHVATCAECAAVLQGYRQLRSAVRSLAQPLPPPALRAAIFARATPAYRRRATVIAFGQRGLSFAAAVAAGIAIFFTLSLLRSGIGVGPSAGSRDTTPPQIASLEPGPNVPDWGLNRPIRITFSEPMDHDSVLAALTLSAEPALNDDDRQRLLQSIQWQDNTLIIGTGVPLRPYTDYTIAIDPAKALDQAKNPLLTATTRYTFRTVDVVASAPTPMPTANVAVAPSAPPTPTATPRPTEPVPTPTTAVAPTATAHPVENPLPFTTPVSGTAPPIATSAPQPTPTKAQPSVAPATAPPTATATTAPPTATPPPTKTPPPTATPSPATAPTVAPSATPSKPPFAVGGTFAPVYGGNATVAERLGLPAANEATVQGAYLAFERGWMLRRTDTNTIYVLFNDNPPIWYAFADGWSEGSAPGGGPAEKGGLFKPQRSFGKVWADNAEVQRRLGFALTADETRGPITVQPCERGLLLASDLGAPFVYVFYQNNLFERYER